MIMIKLTGRLVCKSAEEADLVRQYLPEHKQLTRKETGCVSFEVTETADPLVWTRLLLTPIRKEPGLRSGEEKPARSPESMKSQRVSNFTETESRYVYKRPLPSGFLTSADRAASNITSLLRIKELSKYNNASGSEFLRGQQVKTNDF